MRVERQIYPNSNESTFTYFSFVNKVCLAIKHTWENLDIYHVHWQKRGRRAARPDELRTAQYESFRACLHISSRLHTLSVLLKQTLNVP